MRTVALGGLECRLAEPVLGWIRCDPSVMQLTGKLL